MDKATLSSAETESDCGKWNRANVEDGTVHVYPCFGPSHRLWIRCWCHPVWSSVKENMIIHQVAQ